MEMTPARHPHQIFWEDAKPEDFMNAQLMDWIQYVGDISTQYELNFIRNFGEFWSSSVNHTSAPAPEPATAPCPQHRIWQHCPVAAQVTKAERERAQQRIDAAIEQLSDINKYAREEYEEANLSDNEREMRIHLEYGNRVWGVVRFLRAQPEPQQENDSSRKE